MPTDFAAFILTHKRPDKVYTYSNLRKSGYSGPIYLIVDDQDPTRERYLEKYGSQVVLFNKEETAKTFDQGDNFKDYRAIVYARNASFKIAESLNIKYFIQLDDDYTDFRFRFDQKLAYIGFKEISNLDAIFDTLLEFYKNSSISSLAVSQGGDFIGGINGTNEIYRKIKLSRKCMNSFICSTDRPIQFIGRVNEDVNTYSLLGSRGLIFFTTNQVGLNQKQTQTNSGGMTEMYKDSGTYIKSFYSVMYQPSSVKVRQIQSKNPRWHHAVSWVNTVPKILREETRKPG